jgi:hypothetical protein
MRTPTIIILGLLIVVGGVLALMNNSWCAPERSALPT